MGRFALLLLPDYHLELLLFSLTSLTRERECVWCVIDLLIRGRSGSHFVVAMKIDRRMMMSDIECDGVRLITLLLRI
jgi:hypothetical protein